MKKSNGISIITKICNKCNEEKLLEEFPLRKKGKDGRRGYCRVCERAGNKVRYDLNIEHKREKKRTRYKNDPNKTLHNQQKYIQSKKRSDELKVCICCGKDSLTRYCSVCTKRKNDKKIKRCLENFKCIRCGADLSIYGEDGIFKTCINCREKLHQWR